MKDTHHQGNDMSIFDGAAGTPAGQGLSSATMGQGAMGHGVISATQGQYVLNSQQALSQRALLQARTLKEKQKENLHDPAWQATISTLENAWLAKFGSEWVDGAHLVGDAFFAVAAERLVFANRLERHVLMSRDYPVYRIVE